MDMDSDTPGPRKRNKSLQFLDLPRELRNTIYGLMEPKGVASLHLHDHIEDGGFSKLICRRTPTLLHVSRQSRAEYEEEVGPSVQLRMECTKRLKCRTLSVLDILRSYNKALPVVRNVTMGAGEEFFHVSNNLSEDYTGFVRTNAKWLPLSMPALRTMRIDLLVNLADRAEDCAELCRDLIKVRDNLQDHLPGPAYGHVFVVCEVYARTSSTSDWTGPKDACYLVLITDCPQHKVMLLS